MILIYMIMILGLLAFGTNLISLYRWPRICMEVSIQNFSISCVKPYLAAQKTWQHVDLQMPGTSESISVCWYGSRYCLAVCQSGGIIVHLVSRKQRPQTTMSHDCHETLRHFDMLLKPFNFIFSREAWWGSWLCGTLRVLLSRISFQQNSQFMPSRGA